jgi:hypothetical protein
MPSGIVEFSSKCQRVFGIHSCFGRHMDRVRRGVDPFGSPDWFRWVSPLHREFVGVPRMIKQGRKSHIACAERQCRSPYPIRVAGRAANGNSNDIILLIVINQRDALRIWDTSFLQKSPEVSVKMVAFRVTTAPSKNRFSPHTATFDVEVTFSQMRGWHCCHSIMSRLERICQSHSAKHNSAVASFSSTYPLASVSRNSPFLLGLSLPNPAPSQQPTSLELNVIQ